MVSGIVRGTLVSVADLLSTVQLRRQVRERREYIYRKSLEAKEKQIWARKQQIRQFLAEGKPIPPELRDDARAFGGKLTLDEGQAGEPTLLASRAARGALLTPLRFPRAIRFDRRRVCQSRSLRAQDPHHHLP